MTLQAQLIAPFTSGLITSLEPWIAPPDAFYELDNFHLHDGYVEKRKGSYLYGYISYSTSDAANSISISSITKANPGVVTTTTNHLFQNGDYVVFYNVSGMDEINYQRYQVSNVTANTFDIGDTSTFTPYTSGGIAVLSSIQPIMGISRYLKSDNSYELLIFDTKRCAKYDTVNDYFIPVNGSFFALSNDLFSSNDSDFIWTCQWQSPNAALNNRIYISNGLPLASNKNGILYYPDSSGKISRISPDLDPKGTNRKLIGGKLIFVIAERLVILNTYEIEGSTTTNYPQRARYSQAQNPSEDNWREVPGGGGYIDAPTGDHIISARSFKDGIIVFFTNSIWTLRYSIGIPDAPFRWYKLNDFRSCGGKMASINYDDAVRSLGFRGITASNNSQTVRIDNQINDFITENINTLDFDKVFCERSYKDERWWTLYPKQTTSNDQLSKGVLIYDDNSNSYSTYSFSMNSLGFANLSKDYTFADFTVSNNLDYNWLQAGGESFSSSAFQDYSEALMGGGFQGDVYQLEAYGNDDTESITASLTTVYWNPYKEQGISCQMPYIDLYLDSQYNTTATIEFFKDDDDNPYASQEIDMLPDLSYVTIVTDVTNTNPAVVTAPQHNLSTGSTIYIYLVEGMDEINDRKFTITVLDEDNFYLNGVNATSFGAYSKGGQVVLRPFYTSKVWKRAFAGGIGYQHAVRITTSGVNSYMKLHGLKPYFKPRGNRTVN